MEVSGYHHNVAGDFLTLRPAMFVAGPGEAAFSQLEFRALPRPETRFRFAGRAITGNVRGSVPPRGVPGTLSCGHEGT